MCGISGIIGFKKLPHDPGFYLSAMERAIQHRGPDGSGYYVRGQQGFLNVRLAIVDREGGAQPIYSDDGNFGIVYNGEVYNYQELREDLEKQGVTFKTTSDTEVILQCFVRYGTESFAKLNGMFAFCVWDESAGVNYIVRDQTGIKPLYVYQDHEKLIFASEMKAILGLPGLDLSLDEKGIYDYFTFRYTQAPFTCYSKISKLEAGYFIKVKDNFCARYAYSDIEYSDPDEASLPHSIEDLKALTREKLLHAVRSQLMGEVPIGVLLSGGVDSSVIAWCIHHLGANLTTYNIGFPDVNEFEFSRTVAHAYDLKHVEVCITPKELLDDFDRVVVALDEPLADPACFPLYRLCKELKKSVTVVLSGEGGDELFGGYPQYVRIQQHNAATPEQRFDTFLDYSYYFKDAGQYLRDKHIPPHYMRWGKYFAENAGLNSALAYDMRTWMPENLMMKADKILMAHSLEGRFPFLDQDLLKFSRHLPNSLKISPEQTTKWLLKESFREILPAEVLDRPKMGFSVPVAGFLQEMKERVLELPRSFAQHELSEMVDLGAITTRFEKHFSDEVPAPLHVWTVFIFLAWFASRRAA